uniref:GRB2 associated binding protein 3 n=1 Tax=Junco hyemalis TaxID=40217 RepID=A0A8C5JEW6_JUNHY
MSSGDVVCTGWLIKSPPEKKLKRYAWRKRWFVLRRGRMSGNPDVLEYYRNSHSRKPIRTIDLNECQVLKHSGPNFIRKEFQNNFVFIVRTTYRTFYLVAKTEEEMQIWVRNISQICNFGHLEDGTGSVESLSHTTSSPQPSPAASTHASRIADPSFSVEPAAAADAAAEETPSESGSVFLPDYLFLSNCESGKLSHNRCDSWSNSDRSLEQTSSDDVFVDSLQSQPSLYLVQPTSASAVQQVGATAANPSVVSRNTDISGPCSDFSSSSPLLGTPLSPEFQADKSQKALPFGVTQLDVLSNTPPPRPPKPTHFSDRRGEELGALQNGHAGVCRAQVALVPRRISLSSLDNMRNWKGECTSTRQQSSTSPCRFSPLCSADGSEDSYVPMRPSTSPSAPASDCSPDGYIPMSPGSLPSDVEPPPVNRDLKPRRKSRPPPLDLRNLSTIREHAAVTRMWTVPYNRMSFISPERDSINSARIFANSVSGEEEESYIHMKPFLSEEQRVDYVQVDEQKTQALQNTKQEWTDERQSKV